MQKLLCPPPGPLQSLEGGDRLGRQGWRRSVMNGMGRGSGKNGKGVRAQCENCVLALNKQIHTNGEW